MTTIVVTTLNDIVDANDGALSLREAIAQAVATSTATPVEVTITFDTSFIGNNSVIALTDHLEIATGKIAIKGDIDGDGRSDIGLEGKVHFDPFTPGGVNHFAIGAGAEVMLDTLRLTNGGDTAPFGNTGTPGQDGTAGQNGDVVVFGPPGNTFPSGPIGTSADGLSGTLGTNALNDAGNGEHAAGSIRNAGKLTLIGVEFTSNNGFAGWGGNGGKGGVGGAGGGGSRAYVYDPFHDDDPMNNSIVDPGSGGPADDGGHGGNAGSGGHSATILNLAGATLTLIDAVIVGNNNNAGFGGNGGAGGNGGSGGPAGAFSSLPRTQINGGNGGAGGHGNNGGNGGDGGSAAPIINFGAVVLSGNYVADDNVQTARAAGVGGTVGGGGGGGRSTFLDPDEGVRGLHGNAGFIAGIPGVAGQSADFLLNLGSGNVSGNGQDVPTLFRLGTSAPLELNEGAPSSLSLTVSRIGDFMVAQSIAWKIEHLTTTTADVSEFITGLSSGVLNFSAGQTSKVIQLDIQDDSVIEPNETFRVILENPTNGAALSMSHALEFTLKDGDRRATSDFNGDGRMDVLFSQPGAIYASNYEWQMKDRAISAQGAIDLYDPAFTLQVVGDFDGDGKSDVVFHNPTTGGVWMWRLDGTAIVSQGAVDVADPSYHLLGSADFNGDGKDDLLFRNDAGFVYQWQMDGRINTPLPVQALDPSWHVQGAGDFDGDGKADILLRNLSATADNGAFYLWKMDGNVVTGGGGIERPPTEWKTLGLGDFDGDGNTDFAVRNASATGDNGAVWVYLMDGATIKAQGAAGIADPNTWHVQQIGDLNGDGRDDILFRNDAGYFYSWDMDGTTIASEGLAGTEAGNWADPSLKVVTQHFDLV